jgi:hypothetical protein
VERKKDVVLLHGTTRKNSPTLALGCYAVPWMLVAPFSSNVGRLTCGTCGTAEIRSTSVGLIGTRHETSLLVLLTSKRYSYCLHSHVMFSLHAARHCHSFTLLRRSLTSLRTPAIRHTSTKTLLVRPRPQSILQQCLPAMRRSASTQSAMSAAAKARLNKSTSKYAYHTDKTMLTIP